MLKHTKIMATHGELFGSVLPRRDIINLIERMPLLSSFILLSQISTDNFREEELKGLFKEMYIDKINSALRMRGNLPNEIKRAAYGESLKNFNEAIQKNVVFSPQSILQLWKWVLAFGDANKMEDFQQNPHSIYSLFYLSLLVNDYLYTGKDEVNEELYAELFSNAVFNHRENIFNTLCRTMLIYTEIAMDKSLYHQNEYLDINKDFYESFGYSIKEYISVIYALMAAFLKPKKLGEEWVHDIDVMFKDTRFRDTAKDVVSSLMTDFNSISKWAQEELDSTWNFIEFSKKPFLQVDESRFLPFSMKLVYEQLFVNLFHKVRHCYDEADRSFLDFYGKPFEKYVQRIAEHASSQSKLPYKFIDEFRYGKDMSKHSPDILIRLENKLLAIEVKSYRLTLPSITQADTKSIKRDTNRMIIAPIKQLHARIKELQQENHCSVDGVNEIYLMVVTQGHYPTMEFYETEIEKEIMNSMSIPIKGYYHVDIEEFESICQVIERRRPIFRVLDNKYRIENRYQSFKTFFICNGYHLKRSRIFSEKFDQYIDEIGTLFFEDFIQKRKEKEKRK
ncbi:NERD domain-containing protein [Bacillus cereus]|nr:NERD domain-containing protein [Bacillus cereus]